MKQPHVLIIGAGFAGMNAAQVLSGKKVKVTLVDRNNYHLFQPLLYQVASSGLNPSEISSVVRRNFRYKKNVQVLHASLVGLDKERKIAQFEGDGAFELSYDYLMIAVGGRTTYFGNDHWAEVAPGLKSLQDAVSIRNRLLTSLEKAERLGDKANFEELTSVVVIGGGPTGVELAGAFAELRTKVLGHDFREIDPKQVSVTLVEGGPTLLAGYDPKSSQYTLKRLEKLGVTVLLNERVTDVRPNGVQTANGFLPSQNVIWAAGVEGHPLARLVTDQVDSRGRVLITPELLVQGEEAIYACGDMTYYGHDERFPRGLPGVAPVAMQQGVTAARNILARLDNKEQRAFKYFDKGKMATIGRSAAVAEAKGLVMRGFIAWCAWLFIHLIYLVDFQDRVVVFLRWIWSYITWHWGVRLIFDAGEKEQSSPPLLPLPKSIAEQPAGEDALEETETEKGSPEGQKVESTDSEEKQDLSSEVAG